VDAVRDVVQFGDDRPSKTLASESSAADALDGKSLDSRFLA